MSQESSTAPNQLVMLERELHDPAVRRNPSRLDQLLHDSLVEIGQSGKTYNKAQILDLFRTAPIGSVWSQDYEVHTIDTGLVLVTYRAAHIGPGGELSRHSLRSSLWERVGSDWKLRYHQGTPTSEFRTSATKQV